MPIIKSPAQPVTTLEAFYTDLAGTANGLYAMRARAMLPFIAAVNTLFQETTLYGLTSHDRLAIQNAKAGAADSPTSTWLIIVSGSSSPGCYEIQYLIPEAQSPWPAARVHGGAANLGEALQYLLIAMRECGGWADNPELALRLREHGLA